MNSELNNYNINNPDGADKVKFNEGKTRYNNDNPKYIKEDYASHVSETARVSEISDGRTKSSARQSSHESSVSDSNGGSVTDVSSSASASATTAASSAASTAASAASAIGGSVGAIAGTVAASVVSAVIVVAAFVSTLVINLSLAMAGMYSLSFTIEMTGAQEEDFVNPIVAVLEGKNGVYREQEIYRDTLFITFDDLEPSTEYVITVKNEEKVFFKKSYFTASEEVEKGFIEAYYEGDEVFVSVEDVSLKSGEFYTVTAKDDKGKVVFAKDDIEPNKEFSFKLSGVTDLSFTLSVNGKVYSLTQVHVTAEPEYDFNKPVWTWEEDFSAATLSLREIHGGETLVLTATVTGTTIEPTCTADGRVDYTATAIYDGQTFSDAQSVILSALTHDYEFTGFIWGDSDEVKAKYVCKNDTSHYELYDAKVTREITKEAGCEEEGEITVTATYDSHNESHTETIDSLGGHSYGEPQFAWEQGDNGYSAVAIFICGRDSGHVMTLPATVSQDGDTFYLEVEYDKETYYGELSAEYDFDNPVWEWEKDGTGTLTDSATVSFDEIHGGETLVLTATVTGTTIEPTCTADGRVDYTATAIYDGQTFSDVQSVTLSALEHDYGELITATAPTCDSNGYAVDHYHCSRCGKYFDTEHNEISESDVIVYTSGHIYGDLIPENDNCNGLAAHYECSVCHKLFDENKVETTAADLALPVNLSLNDDAIYIDPNGYARARDNNMNLQNATAFVSSENNRYIISGSRTAGETLDIQNLSGTKQTFYLTFEDGTEIIGTQWATAFRIIADSDIDIYIINEGTTRISGGNHAAIEVQTRNNVGCTVNVYVKSSDGFNTFICERQDGGSPSVVGAVDGCTINLFMNDVKQ